MKSEAKAMKKIISISLALIMVIFLASCSSSTSDDTSTETSVSESGENIVKIQMTVKDFGTIDLELYPDTAPITVANFVKLANEGFYDGLTFHRIVQDFMIQGGDPEGNGTGGSDETIKGEFSENGIENDISHVRGVISMARSSAYDSASSQFFIVTEDSTFLDGQYAAFGKVTDGMDVVDAIAAVDVEYGSSGEQSSPVDPPVIESVTVVD